MGDNELEDKTTLVPLTTTDDEASASEGEDSSARKKRKVKKKKKKKIYHRSDFVGEPSSSEDENAVSKSPSVASITDRNPADLDWLLWFWYYIVVASVATFHGAEFCGEKLADWFGITAPKYQYAINEYHRLKAEEEEEEQRERREFEAVQKRKLEKLSNVETGEVDKEPDVAFAPDDSK